MPTPLVLSETARLCLRCTDDELLTHAQPFILNCSQRLDQTGDLEDSVLRAAEAFPDVAGLFAIEPGRIAETFGLREDLFERFLNDGIAVVKRRESPTFAPPGVPGVYCLQHACLLYRTETTGILVDPRLHSTYGTGVASDLCRDTLEGTLRIGDAEVHGLPFCGEQAWRFDQPKNPDIRNWGNTYAVKTDDHTSWFLIDSGADVLGSMTEVAEHVRRTLGKIDFVLGNLGQFYVKSPLRGEPGCTGRSASDIPGQREDDLTRELAERFREPAATRK
jgi:hypothetical protein